MHAIPEAANILEVSEYEVMRRAYAHWHGAPAPGAAIDRAFSRYLKEDDPPYWARHYADQVVREFTATNTAGIWIAVRLVTLCALARLRCRRSGYSLAV
jgi:hypothetical protein